MRIEAYFQEALFHRPLYVCMYWLWSSVLSPNSGGIEALEYVKFSVQLIEPDPIQHWPTFAIFFIVMMLEYKCVAAGANNFA